MRVLPVAGLPVGDQLVRHELQPGPLPQPDSHPLLGKGPGSPVHLRGRLGGKKQVSPVLDFDIDQKQISPQICPARIHDHITNLPGVIKIVRAKHAKSTLMKLVPGNGPAAPLAEDKLQPPSHWAMSGRG
ncbi:hypothetical protein GCM10011577_16890 [Pseudarthrobacter polychromogenes]|uniref:Uncharacterized protein n=1 Tax=Pseudarthrobacter polychromogenes TaxID=1676 RepID=A0ABQ1XIM0_9MICC|nr:hypothetical protein GCM10011577_16890 [Pseudarthrobacter polychromogenes]